VSRYLLVVPPLMGHVAPLLGVATELVTRGHQVMWVGSSMLRPLVGDQPVHETSGELPTRPPGLRGMAALKWLVEDYLVPLAEDTTPAVDAAITRFSPDVVIADQQAYAGALAADRHGLPWVTSASTPSELRPSGYPKVDDWLDAVLTALRTRLGGAAAGPDPRYSADLILAFTTPELAGPEVLARPALRFVGPAVAQRPQPPWSRPWPDGAPLVLVTLGTTNVDVGDGFLTACADALAARPGLRGVIVDPGGFVGATPDTIRVLPQIPQLSVLPHADLVVCHGGHNTVCEALWHGLPLVVAPIRDDQQLVAGQVVAAGAGRRLRFARSTAAQVGAAIDTVLTDPGYPAAARVVRDAFRSAGGTAAAADHLVRLAAGRSAQRPVLAR
jgi:UDP:flavonoid glycosyltransferase YjiC (YdhE family)